MSASEASRFSLRQVIKVVVIKPISEVTDVMTEPINAMELIELVEFSEEGSTSGFVTDDVGETSGFSVAIGVFKARDVCVADIGLLEVVKRVKDINTTKVDTINKTRNTLLAVFKILPDYGFFLKRTNTRFLEHSLKVSI